MWDTVVIGAGPGGISAGIWAHRLGLMTLVLEAKPTAGGQLNELHGVVVDYPGLPVQKGIELAPHFTRHLEQIQVPFQSGTGVVAIDAAARAVTLEDGTLLSARSLILATGAQRRRLGVPGEESLWGKGLSDSPTRDRENTAGRAAVVIGGGDAALENALLLADICPHVTLIHRRDAFRGRPEFIEKVMQRPNIRVRFEALVTRILGNGAVSGVEIQRAGRLEVIEAERVFVKIGVAPSSALLRGQVAIDAQGYIQVDRVQETSATSVFAVGDVCNPVYSSIVTAVGQGMVAAKTLEERLRRFP